MRALDVHALIFVAYILAILGGYDIFRLGHRLGCRGKTARSICCWVLAFLMMVPAFIFGTLYTLSLSVDARLTTCTRIFEFCIIVYLVGLSFKMVRVDYYDWKLHRANLAWSVFLLISLAIVGYACWRIYREAPLEPLIIKFYHQGR